MVSSSSKYIYYIFFSLLIFYCSSVNQYHLFPVGNQTCINKYAELLNYQYPDSFALTQRIILNVAGKQYDFIGQLIMDRNKAFRAVAFGEMGGQFIDILKNGDSVSILANPTNMPEKPILQGVAEDLKQLFHYYNYTELDCSNSDKNTIEITINTPDDGQLIYSIDINKNRIHNLESYFMNKLIRSAKFMKYNKHEVWDREIPSLIYLTNHRWHYSLEIRLLQFGNQYDANKVFKTN